MTSPLPPRPPIPLHFIDANLQDPLMKQMQQLVTECGKTVDAFEVTDNILITDCEACKLSFLERIQHP